jgi:hypothetical protein
MADVYTEPSAKLPRSCHALGHQSKSGGDTRERMKSSSGTVAGVLAIE